MEILPAVNSKREMTERLVQWIGKCSLKRTFTSLAEETGLNEKTIRNIFRDHVNELEATLRFETPKWMGIDEIHLIKPRGVITNIKNNTVVELLANRNQETIAKYLTGSPSRANLPAPAIGHDERPAARPSAAAIQPCPHAAVFLKRAGICT